MKASVIIPTKNPGKNFKQVLEAVMGQKAPWPYEVLVIDSGSTDGTVEFVKKNKEIKLHQIEPNEFGHGKTRNLAISLTSGHFLVMMTHDALPYDAFWLANLVKSVEQSELIAGAFGRHVAYSHDGPLIRRDLEVHFNGFLKWPKIVRLEDKNRYKTDAGYRQFLHFFSDNNACLRREVWEKIPYPDVDFAEDQLWAKQIIEAGYSKAYADDAIVYHSHSYSIIDTFRRGFDESRALNKLFGYVLCPTLKKAILHSALITISDCRFILKNKGMRREWQWLISSPFKNIAKQLGFYLGKKHEVIPLWLTSRISKDISLKNGR